MPKSSELPGFHEAARIDIPSVSAGSRLAAFPWWFLALILIAIATASIIFARVSLFTTDLQPVPELEAGRVSEDLKQQLADNGALLSKAHRVIVKKPGEYWQIVDGVKAYYIHEVDGSLEVDSKTSFGEAFAFIRVGISITVIVTLIAFAVAIIFGLLAGLARISRNVFLNNLGTFYVEFIRGIPILVLIFFIALVAVPTAVDGMNAVGDWLVSQGMTALSVPFLAITNQDVPTIARAVIALAITYGAFLAEIFRAGIQSIGRGQMEAARSLGMSYGHSMRHIILPQAIRNVLPALGNDFIAMVKDSSLVSVLAVRDITQVARLYAGSSFRFRESYLILSVMYLTITVLLSVLVQRLERRMGKNE